MYIIMASRKGASSLQLSKEIGVTQKTAWFLARRLRLVCGGDYEKLSGIVEMTKLNIGGKEQNKDADERRQGSQGGKQQSGCF